MRRYCLANRLAVLWTLTYADKCWERDQALRDAQAFGRRLRETFGAMAWVRALEPHQDGSWHVHVALPDRFLPHGTVEQLWGHGFVQYSRRRGAWGSGGVRLAEYVAKSVGGYVTKAYEAGDGRHGYEVAQGFQPEAVVVWASERGQLWTELVGVMGGEAVEVRAVHELVPDYGGPPCYWLRWELAA